MPGDRVVRLAEGLEQGFLLGRRQADTGVVDADAQQYLIGVLVFGHDPHADRALMGELDGIADQVGEDLLEPHGVAAQAQRGVTVDDAHQLQALVMGAGGEHGQSVIDQVAQVEREVFQNQLAGLDLGEVQDLVDDRQQVVGGFLDGRQVFLLAAAHLGALQQTAEAEDAIQRGAQLVAHVGEEFGLDAAGFLGGFACQVQFDVLDLDGFQGLAQVLGRLVDILLQLALGALHGLRHGAHAQCQVIQFAAALFAQADIEMPLADLPDGCVDAHHGVGDAPPHDGHHQAGDGQAENDGHQGCEQALVAAQQQIAVAQLHLQPAQQAVCRDLRVGLAVAQLGAGQQRHEKAAALPAALDLQAGTGGHVDAGERLAGRIHQRAAMLQRPHVDIMQTQGADIGMVEGGVEQLAEAVHVAFQQGVGGGSLQVLDGHQAPLQQLLFRLAHLLPGEVAAQRQGHQPGGDERHQQQPGLEAQIAA